MRRCGQAESETRLESTKGRIEPRIRLRRGYSESIRERAPKAFASGLRKHSRAGGEVWASIFGRCGDLRRDKPARQGERRISETGLRPAVAESGKEN